MTSKLNHLSSDVKHPFGRWLYLRFIKALFTGSEVALPKSEMKLGSVEGWSDDALNIVIEEGRRELDDQNSSLDRILSRAQLLFTTVLALITLTASSSTEIWWDQGDLWLSLAARLALIVGGSMFFLSLLGAAAIIAVKKRYERVTAAVIATWDEFDLVKLADDYSQSVGCGDQTNNANLTVFGIAVQFTVYGSIGLGAAWLISAIC